MTGQSNLRPPKFSIVELANGMSEIMLYENVIEKETIDPDGDTQPVFEYDQYELHVASRSGLQQDVDLDFDQWLLFAKGQTSKPLSDKEKLAVLDQVVTELMLGGV